MELGFCGDTRSVWRGGPAGPLMVAAVPRTGRLGGRGWTTGVPEPLKPWTLKLPEITAEVGDAALTCALTSVTPPSFRLCTSSVALSAWRTTPLLSMEPLLQGGLVATDRK